LKLGFVSIHFISQHSGRSDQPANSLLLHALVQLNIDPTPYCLHQSSSVSILHIAAFIIHNHNQRTVQYDFVNMHVKQQM